MAKLPTHGGGFPAIAYTFAKARESGGFLRMFRAMRSHNACKTCALGMGGQRGGMVNELGQFPEFCKKSVQAMAADLQPAIPLDHLTSVPLAQLAELSPRQLEGLGRLTAPLVAEPGATHLRATTWDEAFDRLAGRLRETPPDQGFFYFSGRSSNEAGFLLQLFARTWGTNQVHNCSFFCHQASGVGLSSVFGQGAGTVRLEDLDHSDLVLVIGANPASNHPRFLKTLLEVRRRGGSVIVVNPLREVGLERFRIPSDLRSLLFGSRIADHYVQPHCGGDLAFLLALAKRVVELGAHDLAFLEACTTGWPALRDHLAGLDPVELSRASGVEPAVVDAIARRYATAKAAVFTWAMGVTHQRHGTDTVAAISALALLRGMVGRPGAGLLPLRGHSNIQGLGTVGVTPVLKGAIAERIERHLGLRLPTTPGLDTLGCLEKAHAGNIQVAWCLGGNLYGSAPDATWTAEALSRIDQVVHLSTTLNTGHVQGRGKETWILPVRARDEEAEPTTQESMFSYVRWSDGGPARHVGPMGEVQLIAGLAERVLGRSPVDWQALARHQAVRQLIAATVPGMEPVAASGPDKPEFHLAGRHPEPDPAGWPRFATADGKALLSCPAVPTPLDLGPRQLRLTTLRSEGQFNTVVYEDHDRYRGVTTRDVVLLHPDDLVRLCLREGQRVTVRSAVGELRGQRLQAFDVRPGNCAMYYPEANVLVPRDPDPRSGTPAFRCVVVELIAE